MALVVALNCRITDFAGTPSPVEYPSWVCALRTISQTASGKRQRSSIDSGERMTESVTRARKRGRCTRTLQVLRWVEVGLIVSAAVMLLVGYTVSVIRGDGATWEALIASTVKNGAVVPSMLALLTHVSRLIDRRVRQEQNGRTPTPRG